MSDYLNEDEQVLALKQWWNKYGTITIIAIVMGVSAMFIFQYWQNTQLTSKGQASTIYQSILSEADANDLPRQAKQAAYLKLHYPNTVYASMASLFLAKQAVTRNDLSAADRELQDAEKSAQPKIFKGLINLRRARVLIALEQTEEALKLINAIDSPSLKSAVENLRGDILSNQGNVSAAASAYQNALQGSHDSLQLDNLINLKLANLEGSGA